MGPHTWHARGDVNGNLADSVIARPGAPVGAAADCLWLLLLCPFGGFWLQLHTANGAGVVLSHPFVNAAGAWGAGGAQRVGRWEGERV